MTTLLMKLPVESSCSGVAWSLGVYFSASGTNPPGTPITTKTSGTTTGISPDMTLFLNTQKSGGSTKNPGGI